MKAFTIAQDVYGRDETFDPRTDTIVRVEAGRLRQRLKHYDETEGRNDPVLIDIPKGTYTPKFTWQESGSPETNLDDRKSGKTRIAGFNTRRMLAIGAGLVSLAAET